MRRIVIRGARRFIVCGIARRRRRALPAAVGSRWIPRFAVVAVMLGAAWVVRYSPVTPVDPASRATVVAGYTIDDFAAKIR